ncbi:MAG: adenylyltransferase/cytidyltransferase family protein [Candidatus Marinimicrobia bacterium]|nr:adenylyltransferase/cytidyltransferase family protein [Candidatus Neomarinimicrobiota bacterium]
MMKNLYSTSAWPTLLQQIIAWQTAGDTLVFTNGCFDVLHPGHRALLDFAGKQGDRVIVGLNTDTSVRALKGNGRPIENEKERANALIQTGVVDAVVMYAEETPQEIINIVKPDILIKGDDYNFDTIVGAREVSELGGRVIVFPRIAGYSTSNVLKDTQKKNKETN